MERVPNFRIVGGASRESKVKAQEALSQALFAHLDSLPLGGQEQLKRLEYPKSEKELAILAFANKETNELMRESGVRPYDIPTENYHIIPPDLYKKTVDRSNSKAATLPEIQCVVLSAEQFRNNPASFGSSVLHETLHLKGHFSRDGKYPLFQTLSST